MSHYADLLVDGYSIWVMRNVADPFVMELFDKAERKAYIKDVEDGGEILKEKVFEYQSTVANFMRRLEIMGHTIEAAKAAFEEGIKAIHQEMELSIVEEEIFSKFDFNLWKQCMHIIVENKLYDWNIDKELPKLNIPASLHPYILFIFGKYVFEESGLIPEYYYVGSFQLGFSIFWSQSNYSPHATVHDLFRAILEIFDPSTSVTFDYTSLIYWGTYSDDEDITIEPTKIIVLTEGSTDREFLEKTLSILHPDLSKFYYFLDFHSSNLQGGASSLVQIIKGFIGASIQNQMIAVFDNDTAARDALRSLNTVKLPENIRVITLPHFSLAESYPTIGPQGDIQVDINGLACSIEIYLGRTVLEDDEGNLSPIQWMGYNRSLNQYNGEIIAKREVQSKYRELIRNVENGQINMDNVDWSGMEKIFSSLFSAFQKK